MLLRLPKPASFLLLLAAVFSPPAPAATFTWDTGTGDGATITEGGGTWQVGVGNWNDIGTDLAWADGNEAVFGGGTVGNADSTVSGSVVLGGDVAPSLLFFNPPNAGTYTIDLGSSTLATPNTFAAVNMFGGTSATILASGAGNFVTAYTGGAWNFNLTGSLTIDAPVTGSGRVYTAGAGNLTLTNPANDFAGTFGKQNGGSLSFASVGDIGTSSAAGAGDTLAVGFNARLVYTGAGDITNRTLNFFGGNNGTLDNDGSGALIWTGPFNNTTSGAAGNRNFTLGGTNTGDNEIQGILADNGDKVLNVIKNDPGTWLLSGDNTHTGTTTVSAGILKVSHGNALGSTAAGTVVANNAKLELEGSGGDLTIAEDITIGGGSGVLNNRGGNNTITGAVTLSNNADLRRSGGTLTFSGGINSVANEGISFNLPTIVDTTPIDLNNGGLTITSNGNNPGSGSQLNVGGNDFGLMRINFGGYLTLGAANVLPADADVEFGWHTQGSSSGTLNLNGFDQTVASIGVTPFFAGMMGDQRITGGGTLTVNQSAASKEYEGRITDGATATSLVKDGSGTLILNNLSGIASSYTGATTVTAGRLQAGSPAGFGNNSAVTVASGATLALDGNPSAIGSLAGAGTVENAGPASAALLGDDFESGSVTLAGVRMYESYIDGGWRARQSTGLGTSAWTIAGGQLENASTSTGPYGGPDPYYQAEGAVVQMVTNSAAGGSVTLTFDYDVAAGDTLYAHFWGYSGMAGDSGSRIGNNETGGGTYGNEESEVIGTGGTSLDAYNLKDGADTGFGGTASAISGGLTGSGTYSITIDIAGLGIPGVNSLSSFSHLSLAFAKDEDGTVGTTSIDNVTITSDVVVVGAGEDNTDTTFSGTLQDGTGAGVLGLAKQGAGTMTLTAANTYTGDTVVRAGTLQIGDGGATGALSPSSPITIAADGTLCFNRSDIVTQGIDFSGDPIAGTGTFEVKGGGTVVLTNNATFNQGAIVSVASGSALELNFTGTNSVDSLFLGGVGLAVGVYDSSHPSGLLTGTGTLMVTTPPDSIWDGGGGDGNWSTAANWLGDFVPGSPAKLIFAGTVNTATNNDLPAGSPINLIDFPNTGAGEGFSLGGNRITLGGTISASAADGSIADSISLDMELNGDRTITLGESHDLTISGVISEDTSARTLVKTGAGTLTLAAANTHTNISIGEVLGGSPGGTLAITDNDSLGTGTVTFEQDGTLELGADGMTILNNIFVQNRGAAIKTIRLDLPDTNTGTLAGDIDVRWSLAKGFAIDVGSDDTLAMSGTISNGAGGGAGLTKTGAGTLVISGNSNSYQGHTTVNAGTLLINGDQSGALGTVIVEDGATFGGGGTIGDALVARGAATIAPGAPVGTLSTGWTVSLSVLAEEAGTLHFDLGALAGPNDLLAGGAEVSIGSGTLGFSDFVFTDLGGMEFGTYTLITSTGITGTLDGSDLTGVVGGTPMRGTLQINGTSLELVVTLLDSDGDGISDTYESANTDPSSPTALDPNADDDRDGFTNLQEARFGTISLAATGADSFPKLVITSADPGGTGVATLELRPAFEGIEYQLTGSVDLVLFSVLDGNGYANVGLTNMATFTEETNGVISFVNEAASNVRFKGYRVEVVHNPNQP